MNEHLKAFLNGINVSDKMIAEITKEDKPEDFTIDSFVENFQEVQTKLFENKYKGRIVDQDEQDKKFDILRGTLASKVAKDFGLELTRKEIEKMKFEDVVAKANEKMMKALADAQGNNDAELVAQMKKLQEETAASKEELETLNSRYESELQNTRKEFDTQLNTIKVNNLFQKEFEKYNYGLDAVHIPLIKKQVQEEILSLYDVKGDGTIAGKDGTHAQDFEGKGIFENVSQPIESLLKKYKAIAKVQLKDEKVVTTGKGQFVVENMSPAAKAIYEAARK
jgi:hypothetical protein